VVGQRRWRDALTPTLLMDRQQGAKLGLSDPDPGKVLIETGGHASPNPHQRGADLGAQIVVARHD